MIELVFEKAINDTNFANLYAEMCVTLESRSRSWYVFTVSPRQSIHMFIHLCLSLILFISRASHICQSLIHIPSLLPYLSFTGHSCNSFTSMMKIRIFGSEICPSITCSLVPFTHQNNASKLHLEKNNQICKWLKNEWRYNRYMS